MKIDCQCGECGDERRGSWIERLVLCGLKRGIHAPRVRFSPGIHGLLGIALTAAVLALGRFALAQGDAPEGSQNRITAVVFADRPMRDEQWSKLFVALREGFATGEMGIEPTGYEAEFVRGDLMANGIEMQKAIVIFLHGDCTLAPLARRTAYGVPLGWVRKVDGQIEPFVHVDCTRIGQVLGSRVLGLDGDDRETVMAGAIARVIAHEWIHIATQSSSHTAEGIEKAQYGVADLMAGDDVEAVIHRRRSLHRRSSRSAGE